MQPAARQPRRPQARAAGAGRVFLSQGPARDRCAGLCEKDPTDAEGGCKAFSLLSNPKWITRSAEGGERNPPFLPPPPLKGG